MIFCLIFSNNPVYYTFIFTFCILFSLFVIYIIWEFFYWLFQGIRISFCLVFINISVYYTFIFILFCFLSIFTIYNNIIYLLKSFFNHPGSYLHNPPSYLGMCHLGILLLPLHRHPYFSISFSVLSLCIIPSYSDSIDIYPTSSRTSVSFSSI